MEKRFADVMLPLPLPHCFTYILPESMEGVEVGCRVVVPFGQKRYYTAIVVRLHSQSPSCETKEPVEILDEHPVLLPLQLRFWEWIASYYLCTGGEVYKAALPSGMKLESETWVELNPDYTMTETLSAKEQGILDCLSEKTVQRIGSLERKIRMGNILPAVRGLMAKGAVSVKEELKRSYKPKTEIRVRLTEAYRNESHLHDLLDKLARAPRQAALLRTFIELSDFSEENSGGEVSRKELLLRAEATSAILAGLTARGVFELYEHETGRLAPPHHNIATAASRPLTAAQQTAYDALLSIFKEKEVCLLHGVTSSGKTELYIHLIQQCLAAGKQVLYLLPEIALTTQITDRLRRVFGSEMGIYHSGFPDAERVEIWHKQLSSSPYRLVVGTRSSLFLPFQQLGLVIIDEEHETSYKQQEPAPRYHARNAAIMLASLHGAKTLLGTATPSVESYYNALNGKYGLVELTERYQGVRLPEIQVVDVKELLRTRRMKPPFSPRLLAEIRGAVERKEQVILFQNRRGFAPMIQCRTCGWVPKCDRCDVSLAYHRRLNRLTCHYCGMTYPLPSLCPACGGTQLNYRGFGTEKIEEEIHAVFPEAKAARMDLDTTHTHTAYERILHDFEQGRTNILVGTQMISKGLDFERVSVVGILDADTMLNFPDFRAHERAFQLMAQVAGRAGRKSGQGLVILQTRNIGLPVIRQVVANDYAAMYENQLSERRLFRYPPFYRLVYVYLKHRHEETVHAAAEAMAAQLRNGLGDRVLGPDKPVVGRIQMLYIKKIVVKVELSASMRKVGDYLLAVRNALLADERFRTLSVFFDVDPQ